MPDGLNTLRFLAIVLTVAALAAADTITLRHGVRVEAGGLTLSDVAELQGPEAQRFAELVVLETGSDAAAVAMAAIRNKLDEAGAHWGKLNLRGPSRVELIRARETTPKPVAPVIVDDQAEARANPTEPVQGEAVEVAPPTGLKALLVNWLAERLDVEPGALRVEANDPQAPVWTWNNLNGRFEFESIGGKGLGRVRLIVRRYRGEQIDEQRLGVHVAVRKTVVVAQLPVQRGQTLTSSDVKTETRWIESESLRPLTTLRSVVGRSAARRLQVGDLIEQDRIEAQRLIRRGQVVTVRCLSGSLVLKTTARAMEDGTLGEKIEVRNEKTRRQYRVTVTGAQQAVMRLDGLENERALTLGGST